MRGAAFGLVLGFAAGVTPVHACELAKAAELPVTMEGLSPLVSAKINDLDVRLVLDSGAFYSVLDAASAKRAKLKPLNGVSVQAMGFGGGATLTGARADRVELAKVALGRVDFLIHERQIRPFAAGLLGQNILGMLDVEYDLAHGVVRIFKPKGCETRNLAYWAQGMVVGALPLRPMTPVEPHTQFTVVVNGVKGTAMLDTGAPVTTLRNAFAARAGVTPQSPGARGVGPSSGGIGRRAIETWTAPFASVAIGSEQVSNTRMTVADRPGIAFDMILGADFLLAHRVFVANSQRRIYFTYNGGPVFRLPEDDEQDTGGSDTPIPAVAPPGAAETTDPESLGRRAAAQVARRDYKGAVEAYSKALAAAPDNPELLRGRAVAYFRMKQLEPARQDLDKALKLAPDHVQARLMRGSMRLKDKDVAGAQADFDAALEAAPHEHHLSVDIADLYADAGELDRAIALYDAWQAAHPRDDYLPFVYNNRCWARITWNSDLDLAAADCEQALRRARPNSATLNSRGMLRYRQGLLDAALVDFEAALKLQPNDAWSLYGRGLAKARKGPPGSGDADIKAALKIDPKIAEDAKRFGLEPP